MFLQFDLLFGCAEDGQAPGAVFRLCDMPMNVCFLQIKVLWQLNNHLHVFLELFLHLGTVFFSGFS
jgi:hypothetical protein